GVTKGVRIARPAKQAAHGDGGVSVVCGQVSPVPVGAPADVAPSALRLVDRPVLLGSDAVRLAEGSLPRRISAGGALLPVVRGAAGTGLVRFPPGCDPLSYAVPAPFTRLGWHTVP